MLKLNYKVSKEDRECYVNKSFVVRFRDEIKESDVINVLDRIQQDNIGFVSDKFFLSRKQPGFVVNLMAKRFFITDLMK